MFSLSAGIMAGYRPRICLASWKFPLGSGSLPEFNGYIQDLISLWAIFTLIDSVMLAEQPDLVGMLKEIAFREGKSTPRGARGFYCESLSQSLSEGQRGLPQAGQRRLDHPLGVQRPQAPHASFFFFFPHTQ